MSWGLFYEIILLCMSILPHLTAFGPVITLIFSIYNIWEHCPNIDLARLWDRLKMVTSHTTHCWLCWGNPVQYFPPSPTGSHKGIFFVVLNSWFSEWRLKRWRLLTSLTSTPAAESRWQELLVQILIRTCVDVWIDVKIDLMFWKWGHMTNWGAVSPPRALTRLGLYCNW